MLARLAVAGTFLLALLISAGVLLEARPTLYAAGVRVVGDGLAWIGSEAQLSLERDGRLLGRAHPVGTRAVSTTDAGLDRLWGAAALLPALFLATPTAWRRRLLGLLWALPLLGVLDLVQLALWTWARHAELTGQATGLSAAVLQGLFFSAALLPVVIWLPWAWQVGLGARLGLGRAEGRARE